MVHFAQKSGALVNKALNWVDPEVPVAMGVGPADPADPVDPVDQVAMEVDLAAMGDPAVASWVREYHQVWYNPCLRSHRILHIHHIHHTRHIDPTSNLLLTYKFLVHYMAIYHYGLHKNCYIMIT